MDVMKILEDLRCLQETHAEDQKLIDELRNQNKHLKNILKEYNAALSRCLVALEKTRK